MRDKRKTPPTPQHQESARFLSVEPEVRAAALQDETLRQLVNVFREHEKSKAVRGTASSEYELAIRAAAAACDYACHAEGGRRERRGRRGSRLGPIGVTSPRGVYGWTACIAFQQGSLACAQASALAASRV